MDDRSKKILELACKFIEKQGCLWAEFDGEGYSYQFYGGRRFQCGTSEKEQGSTMSLPFDITEILTGILTERSDEIPEEIDSWDRSGYLSSVSVKIYPKERKIVVSGIYQVPVTLDEVVNEFEIPVEVITIMNTWGIEKCRIDFNGGGDSGYIEDTIYDTGGDTWTVSQIDDNMQLENFMDSMLNEYGDWYNNEGASGYLDFNVPDKTASYHVFPNDYAYEDEFLFSVDF